jgi:exosortase
VAGAVLAAFGLAMYAIGRSQQFHQFEVGSAIPVLAGLVLALRGTAGLRAAWFPLFFLAFVVPLPGSVLDAILVPLKQLVSIVAEEVMYLAGYPVARTGVVLTIGPYQLLIADACSGLSSMIALTGIGLVYVYVAGNPGRLHNAVLLAAVLPIAFIANLARVCLLMWVTFTFGDAAGQRFHDQAGYLEIAFAFALFFGLDALLRQAGTWRRRLGGVSTPFRRSSR